MQRGTRPHKASAFAQLRFLENEGVLSWQHATNSRVSVTPVGGTEIIMSWREAWMYASAMLAARNFYKK